MGRPTDLLTEPTVDQYVDPAEITGPVTEALTLDVGGLILEVLAWIGIDPAGEVTEAIGGDWEAIERAVDALGSMADFLGAQARSVASDCRGLEAVWRGNAADTATSWFSTFADTLDDPVDGVRAAHAQAREFADGVRAICMVITDGVREAMAMMINAVATAWFPPLAVYQGLRAGSQLVRVLAKLDEVATAVGTFVRLMDAVATRLLDQLEVMTGPGMAPYRTPNRPTLPMSGSEA